MNQKRRGFTLIELLAVIVILAIIALIAVPVIMNIISKANESAFKDSAYGVISAGELYFADRQLEPNGMQEDVTITLPDTTKKLQIKGEVPTGSILITKEGKIAIAVQNGRYCVIKGIDDKDVTITEDVTNCNLPGQIENVINSDNSCIRAGNICTDSEIIAGVKVNVNVNNSQSYDFYVISNTATEMTLIMDRNLGEPTHWISKTDYDNAGGTVIEVGGSTDLGPLTSLNYLNSLTVNWSNVPIISNYTYANCADLSCISETFDGNWRSYKELKIQNGL